MSTQSWIPLKPYDAVQIVAPASKSPNPPEDPTLCRELLKSWQLNPIISPTIFAGDDQFPELANTDENRFADLKQALENPQIKAIWCLRGGYGTLRLLQSLKSMPIPAVKLFIGFSDITLLHWYFQKQWGWHTIHGPMALQVAKGRVNPQDVTALKQLMFGEREQMVITDLEPMNAPAKNKEQLVSTLMGGNLTLTSRMLGTDFAVSTQDKILFWEEINEPFRKIDGMLWQWQFNLLQAVNRPKAIILGQFTHPETKQSLAISHALFEFAERLAIENIPVLRCLGIGHGEHNHPLPQGSRAVLTLGSAPQLTIQAGSKKLAIVDNLT